LNCGSITEIESHTFLAASLDTMPSHWNAEILSLSDSR